MSDPFMEEIERQAREAAEDRAVEDARLQNKYNPRIASRVGEALEVTVDLDDNAGPDDMIEAMQAAARAAGLL